MLSLYHQPEKMKCVRSPTVREVPVEMRSPCLRAASETVNAMIWSRRRESNPHPSVYETVALST